MHTINKISGDNMESGIPGTLGAEKRIANEEALAYWTERVRIGKRDYDLTVATSTTGLCWLSLGNGEDEEANLVRWATRWLPGVTAVRRREPNEQVLRETHEYLAGDRVQFAVPLRQKGTSFQLRVWQELGRIPYGQTCSYADIAIRVGNPRGVRAVGMANHHNPIAIIVPCHRVIGKYGHLTGYGGGIDLKQELLNLEAKYLRKLVVKRSILSI